MHCASCRRSLGPLTLLSSMGYPTCPTCNQTYVADVPWVWPAMLFVSIPYLDWSFWTLGWVASLIALAAVTQRFHPVEPRRRLGPWITSFRARRPGRPALE